MNEFQQSLNDKTSMLKDIKERRQITEKYQMTGILDREDAIQKIQLLRLTDNDVAAATATRLAVSSTPFSQTSDQGIIAELQMQVEILTVKVIGNCK